MQRRTRCQCANACLEQTIAPRHIGEFGRQAEAAAAAGLERFRPEDGSCISELFTQASCAQLSAAQSSSGPAQLSPAQPSSIQPSPALPSSGPAQPSPAWPSSAQPSSAQLKLAEAQPSPAQLTPSPAQPKSAQISPNQPKSAQPSSASVFSEEGTSSNICKDLLFAGDRSGGALDSIIAMDMGRQMHQAASLRARAKGDRSGTEATLPNRLCPLPCGISVLLCRQRLRAMISRSWCWSSAATAKLSTMRC